MLHLFPPSSLDSSILTSVLVGVLIVWLFQELLGWNNTGLVVPGYLASILVIQPVTGLVVVGESVLTWWTFSVLSDRVPRWWPWSPWFGRDRFFGILLVSVAVRIVLEGGGFQWLQSRWGIGVDQDLHSMSLVVVPLAANAIWRTGPIAAWTRLGVPVVLTWAVLQLVLLRFTNLSLSTFELTYEDLALDFVSSPRAYILLLTGAWLGSAANLRWGWDYGGIIVPGLLSLCWLEPSRLVATLGEAFVIATAVRLAVRLPVLKTANLTGSRPLILAFVLGYLIKFGVAWSFGALWPGLAVRDLFGFGYLLPTMIALRVLRAGDDAFRPIVPALLTSLASFCVGSGVGYALAVVWPAPTAPPQALPADAEPALALATLAWADAGPPPDAASLVDMGASRVQGGGEGFGALWVRPEGAPLVVTARVGRPGMPAALIAVAEATDARWVLLCGERGNACDEARRALGLRMPVLELRDGPRDGLRVDGPLPPEIQPAALSALLGPLPLQPDAMPARDPKVVLDLTEPTRLRAGAHRANQTAAPLADARVDTPLRSLDAEATLPLRVLASEVVGPWMSWWRAGPEADDALRLAAFNADALGLTLAATADRAALTGPGFRATLDRRGAPHVVRVAQVAEDDPTPPAARALTLVIGAAAIVEDAPAALRRLDAREVDRPAHAVFAALLDGFGPAALATDIRAARSGRDAEAELIWSTGRPWPPQAPAPVDWPGLAHALGVEAAPYDGSYARAWFADGGNVARQLTRAATDRDAHQTVFLGSIARDRLVQTRRNAPMAFLIGAAEWADLVVDLGDPSLQVGAPDAGWRPALDAALQVVKTGGMRELARLRQVSRPGEVGLARDPVLGPRWLGVRRCGADTCEVLLVPLTGTCARCAAADPLAALRLGTQAVVVQMGAP